jgi:hypothetical protein
MKSNKQTKDPIAAIEKAMEKIVPMTGVIYARDGRYVVTWEDILCELQEFVSNGCASSDTDKHIKQFVSAVREHTDYMYRRVWDFDGLEDVSAVAEHITLHALSKIGLASINANPLVFIRASITTEEISTITSNHFYDDFVGGDHLLEAVIRASTSNVPEDETQPVLNPVDLLLDERQPLNHIIEMARRWTKDPQWIADHAIELATARVLEDLKKIGAANAS